MFSPSWIKTLGLISVCQPEEQTLSFTFCSRTSEQTKIYSEEIKSMQFCFCYQVRRDWVAWIYLLVGELGFKFKLNALLLAKCDILHEEGSCADIGDLRQNFLSKMYWIWENAILQMNVKMPFLLVRTSFWWPMMMMPWPCDDLLSEMYWVWENF